MADQHIAPPERARRGNGPGQRATRRNLSVLKRAEDEQRAHELELAKAQADSSSRRETALAAATSTQVPGESQTELLARAEKFLEWLKQ